MRPQCVLYFKLSTCNQIPWDGCWRLVWRGPVGGECTHTWDYLLLIPYVGSQAEGSCDAWVCVHCFTATLWLFIHRLPVPLDMSLTKVFKKRSVWHHVQCRAFWSMSSFIFPNHIRVTEAAPPSQSVSCLLSSVFAFMQIFCWPPCCVKQHTSVIHMTEKIAVTSYL